MRFTTDSTATYGRSERDINEILADFLARIVALEIALKGRQVKKYAKRKAKGKR